MRYFLLFIGLLMHLACRPDQKIRYVRVEVPHGENPPYAYRYLALGDSYTIGTAIGVENSYASLLRDSLETQSTIRKMEMEIIAKNGWTTRQLLGATESLPTDSVYDMVTLLIGVNNQYQGRSLAEYRQEFRVLAERSILQAGGDPQKVIALSIPDWGATPAGNNNRNAIASAIDAFNRVNREVSDSLGVHYLDITPVSRTAKGSPALVAQDGLHFSGSMHQKWLALLYPVADSILRP